MPRWKDRVKSQAYIETHINKEAGVVVKDVSCPYRRLHRKDLLKDSSRIQLKDGGHCVLSDVYHLYRHIEINNMWSMIDELSKYTECLHEMSSC
jgi:hypothetical protein